MLIYDAPGPALAIRSPNPPRLKPTIGQGHGLSLRLLARRMDELFSDYDDGLVEWIARLLC